VPEAGVHAVGADDGVEGLLGAVVELDVDAIPVVGQRARADPRPDEVGHAVQQGGLEVGSAEHGRRLQHDLLGLTIAATRRRKATS
jgi:hypothetical protein